MKYQKKKKLSKSRKAVIAVAIVLAVILAAGLGGYMYIDNMLGKVNYKKLNTSSVSKISQATKDIHGNPLMADRDVLNVMLAGLDNRTDTTVGGRSDSMIILSINKNTKRIIMTSVMRDTYLPIEGHDSNRLNAAYSFGGMSLLINTIEKNFDIRIDRYVTVDFAKFIKIVDLVGGVKINVQDKEVSVLNHYLDEINSINKLPAKTGYLTKGGDILLNGRQALAYSRIRYVGNGDFGRTERQRIVLNAVFAKFKSQNVLGLTSIMNQILPDITTDMTQDELKGLVFNSLTYKNYKFVQNRIPIDGSYKDITVRKMDVLQVDFTKNIESLKSVIYGTGVSPNKGSR